VQYIQAYITAVWAHYRHIQEEWGERGKEGGWERRGKRTGERGEERKCKDAKVNKEGL